MRPAELAVRWQHWSERLPIRGLFLWAVVARLAVVQLLLSQCRFAQMRRILLIRANVYSRPPVEFGDLRSYLRENRKNPRIRDLSRPFFSHCYWGLAPQRNCCCLTQQSLVDSTGKTGGKK